MSINVRKVIENRN